MFYLIAPVNLAYSKHVAHKPFSLAAEELKVAGPVRFILSKFKQGFMVVG